jgi:small-conductance mechanosensitive channel
MSNLLEITWVSILVRTLITLFLTGVIVKVIGNIFGKQQISNRIHIKFLKNILIAIVWIMAITSIASQFDALSGIANTILAGSGIIAAVLGLAAQESFANIFSGLLISIFKPFDIGDRIKIVGDDTAGFVEDITLRHTVIRTYMNVRIIIPNSIMGSSKLENSTYSKGACYPIDVTIAYEDKEKRHRALEIMEEVVTQHPLFYDNRTDEQKKENKKPVEATCISLGESGVDLRILMWTENVVDNNKACSDCRIKILDRFEEEGIEIPYNKLVIINKED